MTSNLITLTVLATLLSSTPGSPPLNENPKAYWVPEAWRTKATDLMQPGPDGLRGGLALRELTLGHRVVVRYVGEPGELVVALVPKKVAPRDVLWTGQRSSLVLQSADVPGKIQRRAVAHLVELLEKRETGWGWLRRDPDAEKNSQNAAEARRRAANAYRLAVQGQDGAAMTQAAEAAAAAPRDIVTLNRAARAAYLANRPSRAQSVSRSAIPRAERAARADGLVGLDQVRAQRLLATTLALAGEARAALDASRVIVEGDTPCEVVPVAYELWLTEAFVEAEQLVTAVTQKDMACDEAWALRIDLLRTTARLDAARKVARTALASRSGLTRLRSALARSEGDAREEEVALSEAISAVERGQSRGDSVVTLASIVSFLGAHRAPLDKWEGDAIRDPTVVNLGLGAVTHFVRGEHEALLKITSTLRPRLPQASGLRGMEALSMVALGRFDDARTVLSSAWLSLQRDLWAAAAEASLLEAEGETVKAIGAWTRYREQRRRLPGPYTSAEAKQRLLALGVVFDEPPSATDPAEGQPSAPTGPPSQPFAWWWLVGAIALSALGFLGVRAARGRSGA